MVRMVPPYPRDGANFSERQLFSAFEGIMDRPDWTVIHSLSLARNLEALTGGADFIAIAPGKGILIIEAKSPKWAEYTGGDWYLDRTPSPTKSPLKQLEARGRRGRVRCAAVGDRGGSDEPEFRFGVGAERGGDVCGDSGGVSEDVGFGG